MSEFWINWQPRALSVLRIMTGFLFTWHGTQKLFGFPPSGKAGELSTMILIASILEFAGGIMILIGFLTRPAAFILCGLMAVAYFIAHAPNAFLPIVNKGELAVLYCFVFLYLFVAGAGEWSVDNVIKKKE